MTAPSLVRKPRRGRIERVVYRPFVAIASRTGGDRSPSVQGTAELSTCSSQIALNQRLRTGERQVAPGGVPPQGGSAGLRDWVRICSNVGRISAARGVNFGNLIFDGSAVGGEPLIDADAR